jgi:O-antigen/teichoic acid export membrane protein
MTQKVVNIAKNTSYFTIALVIQKVISFTYFTILARSLDPEYLGKYYFAISSVMIFSVLVDMGLTNVLMREVSKTQEQASRLLGSVLMIKIPLTVVAVVSIFIYANVTDISVIARNLIYLATISMILDSYTNTFFAVIRGFHNLKFESFSSVFFQMILMTLGLLALKNDLSLYYLMLALVCSGIFSFSYSALLVKFKWKIDFFSNARMDLSKSIVLLSLPFASFVILQRLYMYLDSVLLAFLAGDYYVGLYQIPFKIIFALQFLPMAFVASLYPAFSMYWKNNKEQIPVTLERAMNYLLIISLPISVGVITLADKIMLIFKPEYMNAVVSLQIVMASLVFVFLNFPIGSLLNACDRQKINMINMGITLIASVTLNFLLIPKFHIIGASATVLTTNILMFVLGIYQVPKLTKYSFGNNLKLLFKASASALLMFMFVLVAKEKLNIIIIIPLAGIIYITALFLFRGFKKEDLESIVKSFIKK